MIQMLNYISICSKIIHIQNAHSLKYMKASVLFKVNFHLICNDYVLCKILKLNQPRPTAVCVAYAISLQCKTTKIYKPIKA